MSSLEELSWDVKVLPVLPAGATPELAAAQQKFLKARYDLIRNLKDAVGQVALADIRGFSIPMPLGFGGVIFEFAPHGGA